jgi:GT2 family glycosyltransferase
MLRLFKPHESASSTDRASLLSQTTAIIKTFQRPECLNRLVRSIRQFYPELRVLVGDDGIEPSPCDGVDYFRLPEDIGVSAGRNALLAQVQTPYFLLLDDDVEFYRHTTIEHLIRLVDQGSLDIAAGTCIKIKRKRFFTRRKPQPGDGLFDFQGNQLRLIRGDHGQGDGYQLCDITHNFYVARVDVIYSMGAWDPELRQNEHTEFFVRARRHGLRVGCCHNVVIKHWNSRPKEYCKFRYRSYHHVAARKIGVEFIVGFKGQKYTVDGPGATIMGLNPPELLKRAA